MVIVLKKSEIKSLLDFTTALNKEAQANGLTAFKISEKSRNSERNINNILSGNLSFVPESLGVKLISDICDVLKLEKELFVNFFLIEKSKNQLIKAYSKPKRAYIPKIILSVFVGLCALLGIFYVSMQVKSFLSKPTVEFYNLKTSTEEKDIKLVGKVSEKSRLSIKGFEVDISQSGDFEFELRLSEGENIIPVVATSLFGNKTEQIVKIDYFPKRVT